MTELQLKIIAMAAKIRVENGEPTEQAVSHYPKLSEEETAKLLDQLKKEETA